MLLLGMLAPLLLGICVSDFTCRRCCTVQKWQRGAVRESPLSTFEKWLDTSNATKGLSPVCSATEQANIRMRRKDEAMDPNGVLGIVVEGNHWVHQSIIVNLTRQPNPGRLGKDVVIIKPHKEPFRYQGSSITRHQYPLKLAWACTIHKTQGTTLDATAISMKHTFLVGTASAALSKVSSLSALYPVD